MQITLDAVTHPAVIDLLAKHRAHSIASSAGCGQRSLDTDDLHQPTVTVWTAWDGDALMGCGALKVLDPTHGEIKSMHTAAEHRRKGVAVRLLETIFAEAQARGYTRVSLETGRMATYDAARSLYAAHGFTECPPFDGHAADPELIHMTLALD